MKKMVFRDPEGLAEAAAQLWAEVALAAVAERGRYLVALSGGGTPRRLYERLAGQDYAGLPWPQSHVFWGDERSVPRDQPESSYGMAWQALLHQVAVPVANVHRVKGEWDPQTAAAEYAGQLSLVAEAGRQWPRLDLVLLGLGRDGHTASLFPGPISPVEQQCATMAVTADYDGRPAERVTLTPLVFNDARQVLFLVTGADKAEAVAAVLNGPQDLERWPGQRIRPSDGVVYWYVDEAAAGRVDSRQ